MKTRYYFIPFRKGQMVDLGGYYEPDPAFAPDTALEKARQQAVGLRCVYNYDSVSIEVEGVIVAVV